MRLTRNQQDVIAPGLWLVVLVTLGFFARPLLVGGSVISTLVLGLYYAARDADLGNRDHDAAPFQATSSKDASHD